MKRCSVRTATINYKVFTIDKYQEREIRKRVIIASRNPKSTKVYTISTKRSSIEDIIQHTLLIGYDYNYLNIHLTTTNNYELNKCFLFSC